MRTRLFAGCVFEVAIGSLSCLAQTPQIPEIVTDRPDITESSIVVPVGAVQAENGFTWTRDHRTSSIDLPETLFRVGLWERTEVRFTAPNYRDQVDGQHGPSGLGDTSIGLKEQLGPLPGAIDVAVIVAFTIPTGADKVSSRGLDPFIKLPWSRDLKQGWSLGGMQSLFYDTDGGRRKLTWEATFYVEREIAKHADVFIEYAGDYSRGGGSRQLIHLGTAYRITRRHQIDFHFGFGLSHAAPSQIVAAGYSFRIDNLFKSWSKSK